MLAYLMIPGMALLNRASGMNEWFPGRNIYATGILVGLMAGFITGSWYFGLLASLAMYSYRILGWYKSLDIGVNEGSFAVDASIMYIRSLMFSIPFIVSTYFYTFAALPTVVGLGIVGALLATLGYVFAWYTPLRKINPKDPIVIAELLAGAGLGVSLVGYAFI